MTEHRTSADLVRRLREQRLKAWKINDSYTNGVPDLWTAGNSRSLWIEMKKIREMPARDATLLRPDLSPLQKEWLDDAYLRGENVVSIIHTPDGLVVFHSPDEWGGGITAKEARERAVRMSNLVDAITAFCNEGQRREYPRPTVQLDGSRSHGLAKPAGVVPETSRRKRANPAKTGRVSAGEPLVRHATPEPTLAD